MEVALGFWAEEAFQQSCAEKGFVRTFARKASIPELRVVLSGRCAKNTPKHGPSQVGAQVCLGYVQN